MIKEMNRNMSYNQPVLNSIHPKGIHQLEKKRIKSEQISKIASSHYYAYESTSIEQISEEMIADDRIKSIAIVDNNNNVKGIIIRNQLMDLLGMPFGRDLFLRKPAIDAAIPVKRFFEDQNIFTIAQNINLSDQNYETIFYAITDYNGQFNGLFSNRDIMIYLSSITQNDLREAQKIQSLIVKDISEMENDFLRITGSSKMAKGLGGDYYTVKKISDDKWIMILCDVSGKGVSASLLSVTLGGMIALYDFSRGLKPLIESVNNYVCTSFEPGKFLTGIFAEYNQTTGDLEIFDMGHSYSYIYRNSKCLRIETPEMNIPLGIDIDLYPESKKIKLKPNEMYIAFSDGIEEQSDGSNQEYGVSRFLNVLIKNSQKPVERLQKEVFADINNFSNQYTSDDMTFLFLERRL
ncbi:MAG: SpoIIE family protein phosphatase [Spirochaetes bacterium]|nr:SpoIIE family protein phosphatase [Spirochaetota bacterium]MBN2772198.1 SpoIIE family protein phosphatase [Spirochaetota bacterium]